MSGFKMQQPFAHAYERHDVKFNGVDKVVKVLLIKIRC